MASRTGNLHKVSYANLGRDGIIQLSVKAKVHKSVPLPLVFPVCGARANAKIVNFGSVSWRTMSKRHVTLLQAKKIPQFYRLKLREFFAAIVCVFNAFSYMAIFTQNLEIGGI